MTKHATSFRPSLAIFLWKVGLPCVAHLAQEEEHPAHQATTGNRQDRSFPGVLPGVLPGGPSRGSSLGVLPGSFLCADNWEA